MDSSREESPDWLRSFQAPGKSVLTLSSGSEASPHSSHSREDGTWHREPSPCESSQLPDDSEKETDRDTLMGETTLEDRSDKVSKAKSSKRRKTEDNTLQKKQKTRSLKKEEGEEEGVKEVMTVKPTEPSAKDNSIWELSSDSEACPANIPLGKAHHKESPKPQTIKSQRSQKGKETSVFANAESPSNKSSKKKSPKKQLKVEGDLPTKEKTVSEDIKQKENGGRLEVAEEETLEKRVESRISSTRLPLVLPEKVHRTKALVECDGESIDLSGDMGAVGRVVISDSLSGNQEMYLDLKGTIYRTTIVPCRTFCVVNFGPSEAKIETIIDDFIQLKPQSNVYNAETMVEGTLEGFSFDSEDDEDKSKAHQTDQAEVDEEQTNGKGKGKGKAKKGAAQPKGKAKAAGAKSQPAKKVRKKTQASKKIKARK